MKSDNLINKEVQMNDEKVCLLFYADHIVLFTENEHDLQQVYRLLSINGLRSGSETQCKHCLIKAFEEIERKVYKYTQNIWKDQRVTVPAYPKLRTYTCIV